MGRRGGLRIAAKGSGQLTRETTESEKGWEERLDKEEKAYGVAVWMEKYSGQGDQKIEGGDGGFAV